MARLLKYAAAPPILTLSGVSQGCPLSPIVFDLALEVVIRTVARESICYQLGDRQINSLACAGDVVLVENSPTGTAEKGAEAIGLTYNAAICATLHIAADVSGAADTVFIVQDQAVGALSPGEH